MRGRHEKDTGETTGHCKRAAPNRLALTVPEVAWLLHCSPNTVWGLIRSGRLDSFTVGRRRMVARFVVDRFVEGGGSAN